MNVATAAETDCSLSSRQSLTFCVAVSSSFSILGQLRLETTHLTRRNTDDVCTMKCNNFGKSAMHSSSASTIKYVQFKLGPCRMLVRISHKVTQAFTSSKSVLPACS